MNKIYFCIGFICTGLLSSCLFGGETIEGNGKFISEKRSAENIKKIKVEGGMNVVIENGLVAVRVETDENIMPYIITESDGEWLKIRVKDHANIHSTKPVTVYLSTPAIEQVDVSGSGNVTSNGKFSSDDKMSFDIAGSGNIHIDVNTPEVKTDIAGSGTLHITGETRNVNVSITGSGTYDGTGLKAENAEVDIAGSGNALVFAEVKLKASIAGSGNIKYKGSAAIDKRVAGSGDVVKMP